MADALAAVNAEFLDDVGFSILHPDGVGGAALDAVDTAPAQVFVEVDRMNKLVGHNDSPLEIGFVRKGALQSALSNCYKKYTTICTVVPSPRAEVISISSVYFFMLGRPIPAPKPRERIWSGAVE